MTTVFVAWRNPKTTTWYPIGRIEQTESVFTFVYLKGAETAEGFEPLIQFPRLGETYRAQTLFPVFSNRLMVPGREDFADYLRWLNLTSNEAGGLIELAASGGRRVGDTFELFAVPNKPREGAYEAGFNLHGSRHQAQDAVSAIQQLDVGSQLSLQPEFENQHDACAQQIIASGLRIGYVPKYLSCDIAQISVSGQATLHVEAIHSDAPLSHWVFCRFSTPWPKGFVPLNGPEYQVLESHVVE